MDTSTYNNILLAHRDRLFSTAVYVLRDEQDAEDVIQEAFLRLWRSTGLVDLAKVPAWLNRVVHNLCIDQTRRRKSLRRNLGQHDIFALENLADPSGPDSGSDRSPATEQEELLAAMATLPAETRSILIMHYFQGLKLSEIADQLGVNVNSLKVRVHRARRSMRLVLTRPGDPCSAREETG